MMSECTYCTRNMFTLSHTSAHTLLPSCTVYIVLLGHTLPWPHLPPPSHGHTYPTLSWPHLPYPHPPMATLPWPHLPPPSHGHTYPYPPMATPTPTLPWPHLPPPSHGHTYPHSLIEEHFPLQQHNQLGPKNHPTKNNFLLFLHPEINQRHQ